jgi:drug/metabolite transporter (DMT)-like permease
MKNNPHSAIFGILFITLAACAFATLDTTTKYVSAFVPFAVVMWVRFGFQVLTTSWWLQHRRGSWRLSTQHLRLQLYRGVLLAVSSVLAFFSLKLIPVSDFTALMMLTPLLMTVVAAHSLREPVSVQRWALVLMGFVGAIVIVRPGHAAFTWASLIPLVLVFTSAGFQMLTYQLAKLEDGLITHAYTGWIGFAMATLALPFAAQGDLGLVGWEAWQLAAQSAWQVIEWLLLIAVCASLGHGFLILGYARAPVAVLTPYLYIQIPMAVLGGWWVFSHQLDAWSLLGMCIVAVSGILGTWLTAKERKADLHIILDN